jgi:hypothetical protein
MLLLMMMLLVDQLSASCQCWVCAPLHDEKAMRNQSTGGGLLCVNHFMMKQFGISHDRRGGTIFATVRLERAERLLSSPQFD